MNSMSIVKDSPKSTKRISSNVPQNDSSNCKNAKKNGFDTGSSFKSIPRALNIMNANKNSIFYGNKSQSLNYSNREKSRTESISCDNIDNHNKSNFLNNPTDSYADKETKIRKFIEKNRLQSLQKTEHPNFRFVQTKSI